MVTMLQRSEDTETNDLDYGGASQYLHDQEKPLRGQPDATRCGQVMRFSRWSSHYFGTYGYRDCVFADDGMYHIGKQLSIWLRVRDEEQITTMYASPKVRGECRRYERSFVRNDRDLNFDSPCGYV